MSSSSDRPDDFPVDGRDITTRRLREQSQLDFELDFLNKILERDPYFTDALRVHAGNLASKGQYNKALSLDRRLVRLQPERPIPWYNLACSYAMLGMIEAAFSALQKSIELGYPRLDHLKRDPDLKSLRHDPHSLVCSDMPLRPDFDPFLSLCTHALPQVG